MGCPEDCCDVVSVIMISPGSVIGAGPCVLPVLSLYIVENSVAPVLSEISVDPVISVSPETSLPPDDWDAVVSPDGKASSTLLQAFNVRTTASTIISTPRMIEVIMIGLLSSILLSPYAFYVLLTYYNTTFRMIIHSMAVMSPLS